MKAKVFIGSSTESLPIAYAIQENLQFDCNPTVWTQGIFQLSSTVLDDLLNTLSSSDFGVFVFNPDDLLQIKNVSVQSVRDNVIFELGLFIGKLGKEKVFFVVPNNENNLHLPTDLLGITPGKYDNKREDGNLLAALGPFCNQIRAKLKEFIYQNLNDLQNESNDAKKIVIEKPRCWEFLLASELLRTRLQKIQESYLEIEKGLIFQKTITISIEDFPKFFGDASRDLMQLMNLFVKLTADELKLAFGEPGVSGDILQIKNCCERLSGLCKELIQWEYRLHGVIPPEGLEEVKIIMSGWTKGIFDAINKIPQELQRLVSDYLDGKSPEEYAMKFALGNLKDADKIPKLIDNYIQKHYS